eukprot:1883929-Pyramimonas_sp.AAC.1
MAGGAIFWSRSCGARLRESSSWATLPQRCSLGGCFPTSPSWSKEGPVPTTSSSTRPIGRALGPSPTGSTSSWTAQGSIRATRA